MEILITTQLSYTEQQEEIKPHTFGQQSSNDTVAREYYHAFIV